MEQEQLKGFIVKKLFHHGYIGGKHTDVENLKKACRAMSREMRKKQQKSSSRKKFLF
ncbi:hypothetical protein HYS47_04570 [Candidatus Woesearchaeota archaeon]|nr:hypothetical protein [Candidatus Woesearchaeota archaeon]